MFLALNEMKQSKLRYGLIAGLLCLVAYLMFFLSGLAFGLMQENRSAVDLWKADSVLLAKDADATLTLSQVSRAQENQITADKVAPLAQLNTVAWSVKNPKDADKVKVSLFGIDSNSFIRPNIVKGRLFKTNKEVVLDQSLAKEEAFETLKYGEPLPKDKQVVNAFITKGSLTDYPKKDFQKLDIKTFITKLPGYSAQLLTFGFMISFLVIISAIIIGIFMYILTIQKAPIFGIMKAQGIGNITIAQAVLLQTFLLSALGSGLGLLGTWLTSLLLPTVVPFQSNWFLYLAIFVSMICFALLGTLFSVFNIIRIDPLKAIG
ncbi:permease family protein [Streptococcus pyogenes]|uniref:FtsX-like permease family protein n=1 Tax=Streptococcus pyogenes TaxID=1314 RepID=UPI0010A1675C|nr:ABC transporter permease [Streptococcus pyogenes]VGQ16900.1 permease family protein [Streptococcus pyogenes]VGQ50477.1 permease family protein [Streptococcus pyogenes]VGQ83467.1 permease family protein [Streptococcus pyogenes]VGQ85076.1 permease family protein [Streptococcus pyogenes]VGV93903.1 permease family protein [Streptococcus pyogenes]